MIIPLYKGKCKSYRDIILLRVVGKIWARILVDRVRRVTGVCLTMSKGTLERGKGCVDQIFTLNQVGEKAREKKRSVYQCFIDLEKA